MIGQRIPIDLVTIRNPDGTEQRVPRAPLNALLEGPGFDLRAQMERVTNDYLKTVEEARRILAKMGNLKHTTRRVDPRLYWRLGHMLRHFIEKNEREQVSLTQVKQHFCRDLGISESAWRRILRFRALVNDERLIDVAKGWRFYRDAMTSEIQRHTAQMTAAHRSETGSSDAALDQQVRMEVLLEPGALGHLTRMAKALNANSSPADLAREFLETILELESTGRSATIQDLIERTKKKLRGRLRAEDGRQQDGRRKRSRKGVQGDIPSGDA